MTEFPCPVPSKPSIARQHCRHYSYELGFRGRGPMCAVGCDMTAPGASLPCMPPGSQHGATCGRREDWTDEERASWQDWSDHHRERMLVVFAHTPDGPSGTFQCPACGTGTVSYARARSNGHLHAACSTPQCFAIMQ